MAETKAKAPKNEKSPTTKAESPKKPRKKSDSSAAVEEYLDAYAASGRATKTGSSKKPTQKAKSVPKKAQDVSEKPTKTKLAKKAETTPPTQKPSAPKPRTTPVSPPAPSPMQGFEWKEFLRQYRLVIVSATFLVCGIVCLFIAVLGASRKSLRADAAVRDIREYAASAETAASGASMVYPDAADALEGLTKLMNPSLSSDMHIRYTLGESYAEAGRDPWGHPYYITAKKLGNAEQPSVFEYYITCAGANGKFDLVTLTLDRDDITDVLLEGSIRASVLPGKHEIVDLYEGKESSAIAAEKSVPLVFDFAGGKGGTAFVEAAPAAMPPDVDPPAKDNSLFLGYFEQPEGKGIQFYDRDGKAMVRSPFTDGATLYAAWQDVPGPDIGEPLPAVSDQQTEKGDAAQ